MSEYEYTGELPPKIKALVRQFKLVIYLMGGLMVGISAVMAFYLSAKAKPEELWLLYMPVGVMLLCWLLAWWILKKTLVEKLYKAAQVMRLARPEPMQVCHMGVAEAAGFLVGLYDPDEDLSGIDHANPPRPRVLIHARSTRKMSPFMRKVLPVNVWVDPQGAPPFVVIEGEKQLMWGSISTRESRSKNSRIIKRIIAGMLLFLLLLSAVFFFVQQQLITGLEADASLAVQSADWPTAKGVVTESYIKDVKISKGKSSFPGFRAVVEYSYQVGGRSLKGNNVHFCYEPSRERGKAEQIVQQLPPGAEVQVSYMPGQPEVSTLVAGYDEACRQQADNAVATMVAIGLLCTAMILVVLLVLYFQVRRRAKFQRLFEEWDLP